jgi:hypothetical protein
LVRAQRGFERRYRRAASAVNLSEGLRHQVLQRRGPSLKTRSGIETIRRAFDARDRARSRGPHDLDRLRREGDLAFLFVSHDLNVVRMMANENIFSGLKVVDFSSFRARWRARSITS